MIVALLCAAGPGDAGKAKLSSTSLALFFSAFVMGALLLFALYSSIIFLYAFSPGLTSGTTFSFFTEGYMCCR